MADNSIIMSFGAHKADISSYPTPLASAFAALLPALARHIEAEREIEDVAIRDPAFRKWLTDAEDAFATVTTHLFTITMAEETCSDDKPLKRTALLIEAVVGSGNPATFMPLYGLLPRFEDLLHCHGTGPAMRHRNGMPGPARCHVDTMATLLTYDCMAEHAVLKRTCPKRIVDPACYRGRIRVVSEIFTTDH